MRCLYMEVGKLLLFLVPIQVLADFSECSDGPTNNQFWANFTLNPGTIPMPGSFSVSLAVYISRTLDDNIRAEVDISRPLYWWSVTVPCVGSGSGVGSCVYDDICAMLDDVTATCNGQPCRCPLGPGNYAFPNFWLFTADLHPVIRAVASNTHFDIKIKFFDKTSEALLSCLRTRLYTSG